MRIRTLSIGLALVSVVASTIAEPFVLITPDEARLPPLQATARRGMTRGPEIILDSPKPGELANATLRLRVMFKPHGGVPLDLESLVVRYLRREPISLNDRVRKFIKPTGILIEEARVPPGEHDIEISLRDTNDREAHLVFRLRVKP